MSSTTSIRIRKSTLLWVKRLQGILQYQFSSLNIDETIRIATQVADHKLASMMKVTEEDMNDYAARIDKQIEEQEKSEKGEGTHLF